MGKTTKRDLNSYFWCVNENEEERGSFVPLSSLGRKTLFRPRGNRKAEDLDMRKGRKEGWQGWEDSQFQGLPPTPFSAHAWDAGAKWPAEHTDR